MKPINVTKSARNIYTIFY